MISGTVDEQLHLVVSLTIRDAAGTDHTIRAIIDTGFDGYLCLGSTVIAALGLPFREQGHSWLADGSQAESNYYEAVVVWDGQERLIYAIESDAPPLIGTELLRGFDLSARMRPGCDVQVTAIR